MNTDPITLAREVLDSAKYAESRFMSISDVPSIGRAAPDLARAVLRMEALADRLDAEADRIGTSGGGATVSAFAATRIRAALNGDAT